MVLPNIIRDNSIDVRYILIDINFFFIKILKKKKKRKRAR